MQLTYNVSQYADVLIAMSTSDVLLVGAPGVPSAIAWSSKVYGCSRLGWFEIRFKYKDVIFFFNSGDQRWGSMSAPKDQPGPSPVHIEYKVVDSLPATGDSKYIYLVGPTGSGRNIYDEYIWIDGDPGRFECIGSTESDFTNYYTKTDVDALLADKQDTLIAGDNITLVYDTALDATIISATGGGSSGTVGESFTTNIDVGGLLRGSAVSADDTITAVLKRMLITTYTPTYVAPAASLSYSSGSTILKVGGTIPAATAVVTFNPGAIMLNGSKQANRAGAATNYTLSSIGATADYNQSNASGSFNVSALTRSTAGTVAMNATVAYGQGPQPKDSDGNDYGTPLAAGSVSTTKIFQFLVPFYWGVSDIAPISSLAGLTEDLTGKSNKSYKFTTSNQYVVFAYDMTYGTLASILDQNGFETISGYDRNTLTVEGQSYYVYTSTTPSTDVDATNTFKF